MTAFPKLSSRWNRERLWAAFPYPLIFLDIRVPCLAVVPDIILLFPPVGKINWELRRSSAA